MYCVAVLFLWLSCSIYVLIPLNRICFTLASCLLLGSIICRYHYFIIARYFETSLPLVLAYAEVTMCDLLFYVPIFYCGNILHNI